MPRRHHKNDPGGDGPKDTWCREEKWAGAGEEAISWQLMLIQKWIFKNKVDQYGLILINMG
jgi:hypothetical protein